MIRGRLLLMAMCLATTAAAAADPPACRLPDDLALTELSLPAVTEARQTRKRLTILTIGGASTAGQAARGAEFTYPARLAERLRQRLPGVAVDVINRGRPAGSTRMRVDHLAADLVATLPDLVIWAPGSSEAGMSEDLGYFVDSLQEGVSIIRAAHVDLLLIDLQWAPSIARVLNLAQYNNAIAGVAANEDVPLLRRSELMRRWNEDGTFNLDTTPAAERLPAIRRLFDCIAIGLADGITASRP